ncbi:MAG: glycosyl transferase [Bacteroidaceae bacterium]|nr:glycosyl transferase [Bacteroidaceae bacterium]
MKKQLTYIPVGGLGNRMRGIASAIHLAEKVEADLLIVWFKDQGLNCRFDELFQPLVHENVDITLREAAFADKVLMDRPRKKNLFIPCIFQRIMFDSCLYELDIDGLRANGFDFQDWASKAKKPYIASYSNFFPNNEKKRLAIFKPTDELQARIEEVCSSFDGNTIGLHIRRTDHTVAIAQSPTELFDNAILQFEGKNNFYLATDSEEEKQHFKETFGDLITTSPTKAVRSTTEGIKDAVVELYVLSRTSRIIGSAQSTYSIAAAEISGIGYESMKQ